MNELFLQLKQANENIHVNYDNLLKKMLLNKSSKLVTLKDC